MTLLQIRHYRKNLNQIVGRYKGKEGYYLYSGINRRRFRPGAIAMIVVNRDYVIEDCYVLSGISVFSKFKKYDKYNGQHVGFILEDWHNISQKNTPKSIPALMTALKMAAENALLSISKKKVSL
jgi:DNA-binding transcriptional regulator of glucitol operon